MEKMKMIGVAIILFFVVLFVPASAHANVIIPMLIVLPLFVIAWPAWFLAAILLVTIVESIALYSVLGLSIWYSLWVIFAANLVSTVFGIFGIPIILGILLILSPEILALFLLGPEFFSNIKYLFIIVTVGLICAAYKKIFFNNGRMYDSWWKRLLAATLFAPFLVSIEDDVGKTWMVPTAILSCLIPYFFASWYIESFIANTILRSHGFAPELVKYGLLVGNLVTYGIIALLVALWLVMELKGIIWRDLLSAKRKFVAKFSGYKTVSEKQSLSWISNANNSVKEGASLGLDTPVEVEAMSDTNNRSHMIESLQTQEKKEISEFVESLNESDGTVLESRLRNTTTVRNQIVYNKLPIEGNK
jgi:hypothetical protein